MAISPLQLTIYWYSAHRAVIFAIAQLSCLFCPRFLRFLTFFIFSRTFFTSMFNSRPIHTAYICDHSWVISLPLRPFQRLLYRHCLTRTPGITNRSRVFGWSRIQTFIFGSINNLKLKWLFYSTVESLYSRINRHFNFKLLITTNRQETVVWHEQYPPHIDLGL